MHTHFPGLTGWRGLKAVVRKRQTGVKGTGAACHCGGGGGAGKASWRSVSTHAGRVGSEEPVGVKIVKNFRVEGRTQGGI